MRILVLKWSRKRRLRMGYRSILCETGAERSKVMRTPAMAKTCQCGEVPRQYAKNAHPTIRETLGIRTQERGSTRASVYQQSRHAEPAYFAYYMPAMPFEYVCPGSVAKR